MNFLSIVILIALVVFAFYQVFTLIKLIIEKKKNNKNIDKGDNVE